MRPHVSGASTHGRKNAQGMQRHAYTQTWLSTGSSGIERRKVLIAMLVICQDAHVHRYHCSAPFARQRACSP